MDNVLALHHDLAHHTYRHGGYHAFKISDPKPRDIHKASVRDRLLHHALHRKLAPFFDRTCIADSYSCRIGKGTHRALNRFRAFAYKVSRNHTRTCWVLKCDVRKFFASIDHETLKTILAKYLPDEHIRTLLGIIIDGFSPLPVYTLLTVVSNVYVSKKGLPLGNLTSQLLVNIYMNEFDQFVKHTLKVKSYVRYADDFVILSHERKKLAETLRQIEVFLQEKLMLHLHPDKVSISTLASGMDFLGWVHFPDHRVLRTSTKRRAIRNCVGREHDDPTVRSYVGLLGWGNTWKVEQELRANLLRA